MIRGVLAGFLLSATALGVAGCDDAVPDAGDFCALYTKALDTTDPVAGAETLAAIKSLLDTPFGEQHPAVIKQWITLRSSTAAGAGDLTTFDELDRLYERFCAPSEEDQRIEQEQKDNANLDS